MTAKFPTVAVTDADLGVFTNDVAKSLDQNRVAGDTLWDVSPNASGIEANMWLATRGVNGYEVLFASAVDLALNRVTVARAKDGTVAVAHNQGQLVKAVIPAQWANQVNAELKAIEAYLLAGGAGLNAADDEVITGRWSFTHATSPLTSAKIGPSFAQQHTVPAIASDTLALLAAAQTFTNKTLTTPTIASFVNATHTHQNAAGGGQLDHGLALTGLTDDDHTQYALLAGRVGNQVLIGGIATSGTLTLRSTSGVGATDAILFQVGNNGATEAMRIINSGNVGIGATAPARLLSIGQNDQGLFLPAANRLGVAVFGAEVARFTNVGLQLGTAIGATESTELQLLKMRFLNNGEIHGTTLAGGDATVFRLFAADAHVYMTNTVATGKLIFRTGASVVRFEIGAGGEIGFHGVASVAQAADMVAFTSVGVSADHALVDVATAGIADIAKINANFDDVADGLNDVRIVLRDLGLMA